MEKIYDPDILLVKQIREGKDKRSFDELYNKYNSKVYNFCLGFIGNEDDAADCSQEIFIKVYRNIGSFRSTSKFYTWLYRIMINSCKDMIRKTSYRQLNRSFVTASVQKEEIKFEPAHNDDNPEAIFTRKQMHEAFNRALQKLNPAFRTVIILRDIEGRTYEEIAGITGKKKGTVRSSIARARYKMAASLKEFRDEM